MNIKGKVIKVEPVQTFASGFQKSVFVIETDEKYPQKIPFELHKERCDIVSTADVGKVVDVHFNVRGNEYNDKFYVALTAWKVEREKSLPAISEKQFAETHEKVKTGNVTVETVTKHYNLTMEQYATLKAAEPAGADDDLPF
jgi:hypothetical protein